MWGSRSVGGKSHFFHVFIADRVPKIEACCLFQECKMKMAVESEANEMVQLLADEVFYFWVWGFLIGYLCH